VSQDFISGLGYHVYTLYLFTASDITTVLWPQTIFAVGFVLNSELSGDAQIGLRNIVLRLPAVISWIWLQLLVLDLCNQRRPESVAEDGLNKPWRPIPSGRIKIHHARWLLLSSVPTSYSLSRQVLGGKTETVALFVLNWIYNDLDAAENWILRNVLNALGITSIGAGATSVLTGGSACTRDSNGYIWLLICGGVISTTIQIQDLYDQVGDRKRGRTTMPLTLGDGITRWLTAGPIAVWSILIPAYWRVESLVAWVAILLPGCLIAWRLTKYRDPSSDRATFTIWAIWIVGLYLMPAIKATWG
jgi:4-hydroxybenzoate polyprenyltransferase